MKMFEPIAYFAWGSLVLLLLLGIVGCDQTDSSKAGLDTTYDEPIAEPIPNRAIHEEERQRQTELEETVPMEEHNPSPLQPSVQPDSSAGGRRTGRLADPEYRARRIEELSEHEAAARRRARAWAERTGSPMRIETNDSVMILIDYTEELGPIYRTTLQNIE